MTDNPKFCSLSHGSIHQSRNKLKYSEVKSCLNEDCYNEFTVTCLNKKKKYCSHSCAAMVNNKRFPKRSNPNRVKNCINCYADLDQNHRKYCSHACAWKYRNAEKINKWKSGAWGQRGEHLSVVIRRYLLETAEYKCSMCGFNEFHSDGATILQIDHINGDGYDHSPANLRVLCPNCHALTSNFGGRNLGSGREYRRKQRARLQSIASDVDDS